MIEQIQELLRKDPFTPFRLILTSGNSYDVLSPWMLAFGNTEIAYFYPKSDRLAELRINLLATLETLEAHGV
jgi:hypothetical protein